MKVLTHKYYLNFLNDRYVFAKNNMACVYYDESTHAIFEWKKDSILKKNLISNTNVKSKFEQEYLPYFKSIVQTYNNDLIYNRTYVGSDYYSNDQKIN